MHDNIEIVGRDGRKRRARPGEMLQDGERFSMPLQFMDAAAREVADHLTAKYGALSDNASRVVDSRGLPAGHRPGFLLDHDSALADAVAEAYEQMRTRLADGWRKGRPDPVRDHASRKLTFDELRVAADQAREDRNERMRNAWKTHYA